ncbi:MAG: DinB family protein [Candidatus Acidiferrales bacterium]
MSLAEALLMEFDQEAQTTKRVLERVPDGKLAWKPHPKSFSLGQLALHIAAGPGQIVAAVAQDTAEAPDFSQPEAKSRQEVLETYAKSMASARASLKGMDDARLVSMWSLTRNGKPMMEMPRIAFLRSILMNHIYHHRGQLSVYLRMLDVPVPSIYGPSADENPFA